MNLLGVGELQVAQLSPEPSIRSCNATVLGQTLFSLPATENVG